MSDTPRTDAALRDELSRIGQTQMFDSGVQKTFANFARQLERELAEWQARAEKAEAAVREHNDACVSSCDNSAKYGSCAYREKDGRFVYWRQCPECPRDYIIEINAAQAAKEAAGQEQVKATQSSEPGVAPAPAATASGPSDFAVQCAKYAICENGEVWQEEKILAMAREILRLAGEKP